MVVFGLLQLLLFDNGRKSKNVGGVQTNSSEIRTHLIESRTKFIQTLHFHRTQLSRSASANGSWERSPALQPRRWAVTRSSHRCPGAAGAGTRLAAPAAASPGPHSGLQERAGTNVPVAPGIPRACSRLSALGLRVCCSAARLSAGSADLGGTAAQRPLTAAGQRLGPARAAAPGPRAEPRPAARRSRRRPGACGSARRCGRKRRSLLLLRRRRHPGGAPASGRPRRPRSHGLGGRAAAAARGLARAGGGGGARPVPAEPGGAGRCRGTGAAGASGREGPGRGCPERRERGAGRGAAQLAIGL